jgi:hypothetical protein
MFAYLKVLSPLQGLPAPTSQIPICSRLVPSLPVLLPPLEVVVGEEPEDACAFVIIIVGTGNEIKPIPITKNKNMNVPTSDCVIRSTAMISFTDLLSDFFSSFVTYGASKINNSIISK